MRCCREEENMEDEFEYVASISKTLEGGMWIAVVGSEIVSKGTDCKAVYDEAKQRYPEREIFIMKVPDSANMIL